MSELLITEPPYTGSSVYCAHIIPGHFDVGLETGSGWRHELECRVAQSLLNILNHFGVNVDLQDKEFHSLSNVLTLSGSIRAFFYPLNLWFEPVVSLSYRMSLSAGVVLALIFVASSFTGRRTKCLRHQIPPPSSQARWASKSTSGRIAYQRPREASAT